jgi:hypothetical protein
MLELFPEADSALAAASITASKLLIEATVVPGAIESSVGVAAEDG